MLNTRIAKPNKFRIVSGADIIPGTAFNNTNNTYTTSTKPTNHFLTMFDIFNLQKNARSYFTTCTGESQ